MSRSPRRTPDQWQALVKQQEVSGQSAADFCTEHSIGYTSFCNWRKRFFEQDSPAASLRQADQSNHFIDLGSMAQPASAAGWTITLRLGDNIELCLAQP